MYIDTTFPPDGSARLAAFLSSATMLGAKEIGLAVDALIAKLDLLGGDPDLEDGHDVEAFTALDYFRPALRHGSLSDDHEPDDDARGDTAWIEWHGRTPARQKALHEPTGGVFEDDEDDEPDTCAAGDDGCAPFMTYSGPRWGSHVYEVDREPQWCGNFAKEVEGGTFAANDA